MRRPLSLSRFVAGARAVVPPGKPVSCTIYSLTLPENGPANGLWPPRPGGRR